MPPDSTALERAVETAGDRLCSARIELDRIAEDRRAAESRAVAGLQAASDAGIANDSWHERAVAAIDSWVDDHVDILDGISDVLQVVSAITGILSFVPVPGAICAPIALASAGLALGIDAALVATGNGDWKSVAVDAGLMALPGLGKLARSGLASVGTRVAQRARPPGGFSPATRLAQAKPGFISGAENRAVHESYKDELRAAIGKPHTVDSELSSLLDVLYRRGARVGNGSTAAAVRHELATGARVGGRSHVQKTQDYVRTLDGWLGNNPTASLGDRAAAENVIRDMQNALVGR